jgi:hypothetical protein
MNMIRETPEGFDCIVNGKRFGTWRSHGEAKAGMQTEIERAGKCESDRLKWLQDQLAGMSLSGSKRRCYEDELWALFASNEQIAS